MKKGKVLVANGSPSVSMIAKALEKLGFDVVGAARGGKEAVERYMELKPDIAFIDIAVDGDGINGIEVARWIATEDPSAVVIMLVEEDFDTPEMIADALKVGAKGYMKKPTSEAEIEKRIGSALKSDKKWFGILRRRR
ncbi:MAG TPA: response regulator [Candidatus Bathyarchaeia archaeon]|nr:response regulator [Candidatus Bathyarchaeia archaeon]